MQKESSSKKESVLSLYTDEEIEGVSTTSFVAKNQSTLKGEVNFSEVSSTSEDTNQLPSSSSKSIFMDLYEENIVDSGSDNVTGVKGNGAFELTKKTKPKLGLSLLGEYADSGNDTEEEIRNSLIAKVKKPIKKTKKAADISAVKISSTERAIRKEVNASNENSNKLETGGGELSKETCLSDDKISLTEEKEDDFNDFDIHAMLDDSLAKVEKIKEEGQLSASDSSDSDRSSDGRKDSKKLKEDKKDKSKKKDRKKKKKKRKKQKQVVEKKDPSESKDDKEKKERKQNRTKSRSRSESQESLVKQKSQKRSKSRSTDRGSGHRRHRSRSRSQEKRKKSKYNREKSRRSRSRSSSKKHSGSKRNKHSKSYRSRSRSRNRNISPSNKRRVSRSSTSKTTSARRDSSTSRKRRLSRSISPHKQRDLSSEHRRGRSPKRHSPSPVKKRKVPSEKNRRSPYKKSSARKVRSPDRERKRSPSPKRKSSHRTSSASDSLDSGHFTNIPLCKTNKPDDLSFEDKVAVQTSPVKEKMLAVETSPAMEKSPLHAPVIEKSPAMEKSPLHMPVIEKSPAMEKSPLHLPVIEKSPAVEKSPLHVPVIEKSPAMEKQKESLSSVPPKSEDLEKQRSPSCSPLKAWEDEFDFVFTERLSPREGADKSVEDVLFGKDPSDPKTPDFKRTTHEASIKNKRKEPLKGEKKKETTEKTLNGNKQDKVCNENDVSPEVETPPSGFSDMQSKPGDSVVKDKQNISKTEDSKDNISVSLLQKSNTADTNKTEHVKKTNDSTAPAQMLQESDKSTFLSSKPETIPFLDEVPPAPPPERGDRELCNVTAASQLGLLGSPPTQMGLLPIPTFDGQPWTGLRNLAAMTSGIIPKSSQGLLPTPGTLQKLYSGEKNIDEVKKGKSKPFVTRKEEGRKNFNLVVSPMDMEMSSPEGDIIDRLNEEFWKQQQQNQSIVKKTKQEKPKEKFVEPVINKQSLFEEPYEPESGLIITEDYDEDLNSITDPKERRRRQKEQQKEKTKVQELIDKLHRQARVEEEVKHVLKAYYKHRDIDKEEYKSILRRAVPQVTNCNSSIDPERIRSLVKKYVAKIKGERSHSS